jgi:hypothetical protein
MELSDGCARILLWAIITAIVLTFLVLPIASFLVARDALGWGYLLVSVGVFSYFVAMFFDFDDNRYFNMAYNVFISFATIVALRDIFRSDMRAGLDFVLSIPIGLLVYFFVFEPLARKASEVGREFLLKGLGLLGNAVVNGLIFLILHYLFPHFER